MDDIIATDKPVRILVVDDDQGIREMIQEEIETAGYGCAAAEGGVEALAMVERLEPDVVITDIRMPELDGIELTRKIHEGHRADVIVMTGYAGGLTYERVIEIGASDFVQKPLSPRELMIRVKRVLRERYLLEEQRNADRELAESFQRLRRALTQTVSALTSAVEMRDPYTSGHQRRVAQLACGIGAEMGYGEDRLDGLRIAGLLHDMGKISIPAEILSKPGRLTDSEFTLLKDHPVIGYEILKGIEFHWPVAEIMLQHHERLDGSGYPRGLAGDEILPDARILAVADVVEAMSSHRPYRPALGIEVALAEIEKNRGRLYDPEVVDACLLLVREKGFRFDD